MINVASLQEKTDEVLQDSSLADPLEYMQNDRVYLYSGTKDSVVAPGKVVSEAVCLLWQTLFLNWLHLIFKKVCSKIRIKVTKIWKT